MSTPLDQSRKWLRRFELIRRAVYSSTPLIERLEDRRLLAFSVLGDPFLVNTGYTTSNQQAAAVARDSDGDFVVVWQSNVDFSIDPTETGLGIYAQRYNAAGTAQGSNIHVNTFTTGSQQNPAVAMDAAGNFVVTWESSNQTSSADAAGIYARRFNASGGALDTTEFLVNVNFTTNTQSAPSVARESNGDFVIVWQSQNQASVTSGFDIYSQRYLANGATASADVIVNIFTAGNQQAASVSMDADGDFVVAWTSFGQVSGTSGADIFAKRFGTDGTALTGDVQVNVYTTSAQQNASVSMDSTGNFVVAWESSGQDGSNYGIYARRFNSSAVPQADPFLVNHTTTDRQRLPSVALDADGDFVITWASNLQDGSLYGVYARRYSSSGVELETEEFLVNTYTTGDQTLPSVASDPNGNFVIAWQSFGEDAVGGTGVFARRYGEELPPGPIVVSTQFIWQSFPQRFEVTFDMDVSGVGDASLKLENLTGAPALIPTGDIDSQYFSATKTVVFTFPTLANGGALYNGRYRPTILAAGISAAGSGAPMAADHEAQQFFFLNGDANHDATANIDDLYAVSSHWMQPSAQSYLVGDFNYSGTVDASDLGILALNWQVTLPVAAPPLPAIVPRPSTRPPTRAPARLATPASTIVDSVRTRA